MNGSNSEWFEQKGTNMERVIEVDRGDVTRSRVAERTEPALLEGEVRFSVEQFALT